MSFNLLSEGDFMEKFFEMIVDFMISVWNLFGTVVFTINGMSVSFSALVFAFLLISIVINVFWKGARA